MGLADALAALQPARTGGICKVCAVLAALGPDDAAALRRVLAVEKGDPARVSAQLIADTLGEAGHEVSEQSVSKHRRGRHG